MTDKKTILVTGAGSGIGRSIVEVLALAGHCVYAGIRSIDDRNAGRADDLRRCAVLENVDLHVVEMDVLSEVSCRTAVDQILAEQSRIDVVVNNAGMLAIGMTEGFTPEQLAHVINTNAISWLRVNRAVLPAMRRQGRGVLVYISSTTARLYEPFIGPYVASKAAGEALAEVMSFEVSRFGVESVIVVPGAFTKGTDHFLNADKPGNMAVIAQYGDLPKVIESLGPRLDTIDAANGGALDVSAVGEAVRDVLALTHGERPARVLVDGQNKGFEELNRIHEDKQRAFFKQLGIDDLISIPMEKR
jgi:NAD(P)-dependent dehydrogenase (short-subunit alcohol dehydrogenase family)